MKKILGISAFYHDAAACITVDGKLIAAAQEERFTRIKHDPSFPTNAIKFCLSEANLTIDQLDAVIFYDKPLLTFERLLQTYYAFAPKGLISFLKSIPIWLGEKLFLKKRIYDGLKEINVYNKRELKLLFSEHHLSHAASAFFASRFEKAAILTVDGVGEWSTATISVGEGNAIRPLKEMHFPHSVGLLYSSFTYFLGFKVNSGEYKLMGLAPFGNQKSKQTKEFIKTIETELIDIKDDGSIWMNQKYFKYATGLRMVKDSKWQKLFGFPRRQAEDEILEQHYNLASAIQTVTEKIMLKLVAETKRITKTDNLCLAGGVALNCVANGKIVKEASFKNIYIQPAAGDAGGAVGAAWAAHFMYFNENREQLETNDLMQGTYLGPEFTKGEIQEMNKEVKAKYQYFDSFQDLSNSIALKIEEGSVIGWFQGKMEFGPRALGNRSIIGNPADTTIQKKINLQIKYRESFRPFAPSVLEKDVSKYFDLEAPSPYMLLVAKVKEQHLIKNHQPENKSSMWDQLYHIRSHFQAITHVDDSARIQTVNKKTNPRYWELLSSVKKVTGHGMLVNTSFNVRGEPIVCTPFDAYRCFMSTEMDYLVIENFVYSKTEQPHHLDKEQWRIGFKKD